MHNTVRSSAHRWYVVFAFILIIIVLILAGCASFNRVPEVKGLTDGSVRDVTGIVVGADSGSATRRAIIDAVIGGVPARSSAARWTSKRGRSSSGSLARPSNASGKELR